MIEDYQALSNAPNDPTLDGKVLGLFSSDFINVCDFLKDSAYQIQKNGFSDFPIFILNTDSDETLGTPLLLAGELNNQWFYRVSYLELFVESHIIEKEGIELFKSHYKPIDEFCCLFVIHPLFTGFIYMPYPEEEK